MKVKLFYGWYIVAVCFLLMVYYGAIFIYGFTAFVNPIVATFGWSMAQLSLASSLRSLETGAFNPVWGTVADRYSPRKLMLFSIIVTALGVVCLSQTKNLLMYYVGFLIMGLGSSLLTAILPNTLIARWFRKDIGKATGVFYTSGGIAGMLVPAVTIILDRLGWQTTLLYIAIGFLVLGIPLSFVIRSRPEDYGLSPDGKTQLAGSLKSARPYDFGTGIKEALKTRAFWHINLAILFQSSTMSILIFYMMPYLSSLGSDRATASMVVMLYTLVSIAGRLALGTLSDTLKKSYLVAFTVVMMGTGLFIFWLVGADSPFWLMLLFAITYGLGLGGALVTRPPILAEYFGVKKFGTIFGLSSIFTTIGGVVAAPAAGWVIDTYHTYKPVWLALIGFAVIALISMLTIPLPAPGKVAKSKQISADFEK
ncbi:MAG: MFS transporter [Chloroflexota bacterium]